MFDSNRDPRLFLWPKTFKQIVNVRIYYFFSNYNVKTCMIMMQAPFNCVDCKLYNL